jgi:hypothetical protein
VRGKRGNAAPILFLTKNFFSAIEMKRDKKIAVKMGVYIKDCCNQSSSSFYWEFFVNIQIPSVDFAPPSPSSIVIILWLV